MKTRRNQNKGKKPRAAFMIMKLMFFDRDLNLDLKVLLMRCYDLSVLLYGMEAWNLKKINIRKIRFSEIWMYRKMLFKTIMDGED